MDGEKGLYIPYGVKKEKELFEGFPKKERNYAIIGLAGSALLSAAVFILTRNVLQLVLMLLVLASATVMCTRRDDTGYSLVKQVQVLLRFSQAQKRYEYKYIFEWDDE